MFIMGFVFLLGAMSSSFFDLGYQCAKDTKRAIPAIILVAIINVASNLAITPLLGVHGVIISNFISYLVLGIYRFIDTKRYFKISISANTFAMMLMLVLGTALYSFDVANMAHFIVFAILVIISICIAPKELKYMVINKLNKRN